MAAAETGDISIRPARAQDAAPIAALSAQLGYPAETAAIAVRLALVHAANAGEVFVAVDAAGQVLGWTHAAPTWVLEREPCVELCGLVVDEAVRGRGIGELLLQAAETWAREHAFAALRVHSNVVRERAHRFYLQRGYVTGKHQAVFEKVL